MDLFQRISKLKPEQQKLLELKLQQQGIDIHQIPITQEYRKNYEYFPLSMEQEPMWVVEKYDPNNPFYEIPGAVMMEGSLDIELLERSTNEVVKRHEILRAVFIIHDDKPVQYILPSLNLPLQRVDFKGLAAEEQEHRLKELREDRTLYAFDLARGPLIKTLLVELGEDRYVFITIMHHIIGDLLSLKLFLKEAAWFYLTLSQGAPGYDLPGLSFQYIDYACWAHRWLRESIIGSEARKKQEAFWLDMYGDEPPVANLPFDFPRPPLKQYEGDHLYFILKEEEITALKEIFLKENATLYILLFTIYYVFLARITGQEDIVVGTPINTRQSENLNNMIGLFVKTAALRNYPQGRKTFRNFLIEVNRRLLHVYKNQDYQYEELVRKTLTKRDPSRNPLFDVIFNFIYIDVDDIDMPGLKVTPYRFKTNRIGFDLELVCEGTYKQLRLKLSYCTKLFKQETALRFVSYLKKIIATISQNPDVKIAEIDILPEEERKRILIDFNDTAAGYPEEKTIFELFETQVLKTPDHTAVVFEDQRLTYRELHEKSSRLAWMLREKGVGPDVIVGLLVERSLEMLTGIMGILKAGGAYLPMDPEYPQERIDYMLEDSGAKILLANMLEADLHHLSNRFIDHNSGTLAYVIYTSGSTGKPKGTVIEHKSVINFINGVTAKIEFSTGKSILALTTISFDIFVLETLLPLVKGLAVVIAAASHQRNPLLLAEKIVKESVNMVQITPSGLRLLIEGGAGLGCLENVEVLMVGGERFPMDLFEKLKHDYSGFIYNMYGPTETTIWSTIRDLTRAGHIDIGKPIINTQIYIVDDGFGLQPIGVAGNLYIAGDGIARGYLNNPELTAEKFDPDLWDYQDYHDDKRKENYQKFFGGSRGAILQKSPPGRRRLYKTGDLARWLPDGNIDFLGRIDHQVKIRGNRIELGEIENRLRNHGDIREAVVLTKADEGGNNYLCGYIEVVREFEVSELRDYLAGALPEYMIPSYFLQMEKLPLTPNGKIDRKALPEPDIQHIRPAVEYAAPRNGVEETLAQLWADVLNIERIGIDDNFFELGGHSLNAAILVSKIHRELDVQVPLAEMSRVPTIRGLAGYIAGAPESPFVSILAVEKRDYYALSSAQGRFYILQQMDLDSTTYNMPYINVLEGKLNKQRFEDTFGKLIRRHESLRGFFVMTAGEPVQRIHEQMEFAIEYYDSNSGAGDERGIVHHFVRPFDLSRAPLLRVGLIELTTENHILMVDMHHIVSDGISLNLLTRDFVALYSNIELQPLKIQYKDFCEWQRHLLTSGKIKEQENYWLANFSGDLPVLRMPTDYPRPSIQRFDGDTISFHFEKELSQALNRLMKETGTTLYMMLLALYNIVLSKYTFQKDIIIGTPIAGRNHADLENVMGLLLETLAVRNYPQETKPFEQFLEEVKQNALNAFENQAYPFGELIKHVWDENDRSRNPLFDAMLNVLNIENMDTPREERRTGDLRLMPYEYDTHDVSKVDLTLTAFEREDKIFFTLEYCTKLFNRETMERFVNSFKSIVSTVVENKAVKLADIQISHDLVTAASNAFRAVESEFDF